MPNGPVTGRRTTGKRQPDMGTCPRCGVVRAVHGGGNRTGLCKDCSSAMSPTERKEWKRHDG